MVKIRICLRREQVKLQLVDAEKPSRETKPSMRMLSTEKTRLKRDKLTISKGLS